MQGFNITQFSSHLRKTGTLQTNKFIVRIVPPKVMGQASDLEKLLQFRTEQATVPGVTLDTQNVNRHGMGPRQKFATNVAFSDMPIVFLDDADNTIWKYITLWINGAFDFGAAFGSSSLYMTEYKQNYATDITVEVYDNMGYPVTAVLLREAFPVDCSEVSLSWGDQGTLFRVAARFAYTSWTIKGIQAKNVQPLTAFFAPNALQEITPNANQLTREDLAPLPGVAADRYNTQSQESLSRTLQDLRSSQESRERFEAARRES